MRLDSEEDVKRSGRYLRKVNEGKVSSAWYSQEKPCPAISTLWTNSFIPTFTSQMSQKISYNLSGISLKMKPHHLKLNLDKTQQQRILSCWTCRSPSTPSRSIQHTGLCNLRWRTQLFQSHHPPDPANLFFITSEKLLTAASGVFLIPFLFIYRLDYCNSFNASLASCETFPQIRSIQKADAWLVHNLPMLSHITPLLRSLPCIPSQQES